MYLRNAASVLCPVIAIIVSDGTPAKYKLVAKDLRAVCVETSSHTSPATYNKQIPYFFVFPII